LWDIDKLSFVKDNKLVARCFLRIFHPLGGIDVTDNQNENQQDDVSEISPEPAGEPSGGAVKQAAWKVKLNQFVVWFNDIPNNPRRRNTVIAGVLAAVALILVLSLIFGTAKKPPTFATLTGTPPELTTIDPEDGSKRVDSLVLHFSASVAPLDAIGKVVTSGITIEPDIKGQWRWTLEDALEFRPADDWGVGTSYTVKLDKKMFPEHVGLDKYKYSFSSAPFVISWENVEFYQDPVDPKNKLVTATVEFTHPVDKKAFEDNIELTLYEVKSGKEYKAADDVPFTVSYNPYNTVAYIVTGKIEMPMLDRYLNISIDSGTKAAAGGPSFNQDLENRANIPGMYTFFKVGGAQTAIVRNDKYEPEHVVVMDFTNGVLETELQKSLTAYLLPDDRPPVPGVANSGRKNHYWSDAAEVGPEILALSTPVKLDAIPTELEYSGMHSFKVDVPVGKYLYIKIAKGLKSYGGYVLYEDFARIVRVPHFPQELDIMQGGALLSLSGEQKLPLVARGIEAVKVNIGQVIESDVNHLITQTEGSFTNPYFENSYSFNEDNITERYSEIITLKKLPPQKTQYFSFDFSKYLAKAGRKGIFFFEVLGWNPSGNYTTGPSAKRMILVTDLGIVEKKNSDKTSDVFVVSVHGGHAVEGAEVSVLGKNGMPVATKYTSGGGSVSFANLTGLEREKTPTVYVVKKGGDLSFLPYEKYDRKVNYSRFDVGGVYSYGRGDTLNAYLFSDRGIYRPGDKFNIGLIVKANDWDKGVGGVPLEATVTDPRGLVVKREKFTLPASGFDEISYKTGENSPTGNYEVRVYIIKDGYRSSLLGSTSVKVEEFIPDRMNIQTRFSKDALGGWVSPEGIKGIVTVKNLYGTPAAGRDVEAEVELHPEAVSFRGYKDYRFFDPLYEQLKTKGSYTDRLDAKKTTDDGTVEFDVDLSKYAKATYVLNFTAEAFEPEGGRSVVSSNMIMVSPLEAVVGYKADGALNFINKNSDRSVDFIAVNKELKKVELSGLKARLMEGRYVSSLVKEANGLYKYKSVFKESFVSDGALKIDSKGTAYKLQTSKPGNFSVVIEDASGTELNKVRYTVVGSANVSQDIEKNAELEITLNKKDYSPGEEILVSVKAPYTGTGLITIERDKVYAHRWFKTSTTSSVVSIPAPSGLEGNGYVNVTFVRSINSDEVFMSPLSYGIAPFTLSRDKRNIKVELDAPEVARPGEPFKIKYKSKVPGKVVVFAVDEGILQVAKYRTPDPLSHYFEKRALEVSTAQILDLLLPEFNTVMAVSAAGGDEDYEMKKEALGKNLNPFRRKRELPVAYWSGIKDVGPGEKELTYDMPSYFNGTLRVMAVAVSRDAVGATEKKSTVRGHFVIQPNVPSFVAPGDEFIVSVSVANNAEGSGKDAEITLSAAPSEHLEMLDGAERKIKISEGRDASVSFKVRGRTALGAASIEFKASYKDKKTRYVSTTSVRPPVPYMVTLNTGYFKDKTKDVPVGRPMYKEFRTTDASASVLPLGISRGLIGYLNKFPYGCTEQVVSKAFPAVVLMGRAEFGYAPGDVETSLSEAIWILRSRQNQEGAFGYWAANSFTAPHMSVYAMHFLLEAKEKGYPVPQDLIDNGLNYLRNMMDDDLGHMGYARNMAYALYVLTRSGVVSTNYLNNFVKELDSRFGKEWKSDAIALYVAATYKLLKQDSQAKALIKGYDPGKRYSSDYALNSFTDSLLMDSLYLYIVSRHFYEKAEDIKPEHLMRIVDSIVGGNYNTFTSSNAILALDAYAAVAGSKTAVKISIGEIGADSALKPLVVPEGLFPVVKFSDKAKKIRFGADGEFYLFYQTTEAGFDSAMPASEIKESLEVQREYRDESGKVVDATTLGGEIEVRLKIRAVGAKTIPNAAIVDLLPGGFEPVLNSKKGGFNAEYVDMREDRVVFFGTVTDSVSEFIYKIKATNKGTYAVPPAFGESMYDKKIKARSLGAKITVTDR